MIERAARNFQRARGGGIKHQACINHKRAFHNDPARVDYSSDEFNRIVACDSQSMASKINRSIVLGTTPIDHLHGRIRFKGNRQVLAHLHPPIARQNLDIRISAAIEVYRLAGQDAHFRLCTATCRRVANRRVFLDIDYAGACRGVRRAEVSDLQVAVNARLDREVASKRRDRHGDKGSRTGLLDLCHGRARSRVRRSHPRVDHRLRTAVYVNDKRRVVVLVGVRDSAECRRTDERRCACCSENRRGLHVVMTCAHVHAPPVLFVC